MNKKKLLLALSLIGAASLASCADTSELYPTGQYVGGGYESFISNRYNVWDDGIRNATTKIIYNVNSTIDETTGQPAYFSGSGNNEAPAGDMYSSNGYGQMKERYPEYAKYNGEDLPWLYEGDDMIHSKPGSYTDQSPMIGKNWTQTMKMSNISKKFSRGILSRLFNGQVRCNAWSSYAYLEIDRSGFGRQLPAEMLSGKYFAFTARAGTSVEATQVMRVSVFDIDVSFYKYKVETSSYERYSFKMSNIHLYNNASYGVSLVGFPFEPYGFDPVGVVGMSISFDLVNDPGYTTTDNLDNPIGDPEEGNYDTHIALMITEVFFPESKWN